MAVTRAQLRTRIVEKADATNSNRWDTTGGGEVDQMAALVADREWRRILNANQFYQMARRQPTSDSDGYYLASDLASGSGDTLQRLYRVLKVMIDQIVYEEGQFDMYVGGMINTLTPGPYYLWYWEDATKIAALPVQASHQATGIWVNWIPQKIDQLSADSIAIGFPDGYEDIVAWETAAMMLMKGGTEAPAAAALKILAEEMRQDMLQDLARLSTKSKRMQYNDTFQDWGG